MQLFVSLRDEELSGLGWDASGEGGEGRGGDQRRLKDSE